MRGSHEGRAKKKFFCGDAHNFWSKASYKPPLREYFLDIAALAHTPKKTILTRIAKVDFLLNSP